LRRSLFAIGITGLLTGQKSIDDVRKALDYLWDNPTATSAPA
jgi:hypothetical protein